MDEEAAEEGIADEEEIEGDEVAPSLRYPVIPVKPDDASIENHRKSHWPYRSWCDCCNEGRGLGEQRGKHGGGVHDIPIIGIDFFFITSGGIKLRKELEYAEDADGQARLEEDRAKGIIVKCILIRDHATKCVFAHVVPCKGDDEDSYAVKLVVSALTWVGHVRLILRSDGEPAILVLVKRALETLKTSVEGLQGASPEKSHPRDSQSNGATEVGIRNVRGMFRTLRLCLEKRLGRKVPVQHPLMSWLLEHVTMVMNAVILGSDGKTSWRRARGRDFSMTLYGFGEQVFYKQDPKGPQHDVEGNMGPRMLRGTLMGYNKFSNSYRILTEKGDIIKGRGLNSRPFEDRWDAKILENIVVTPWDLRPRAAPHAVELGEPIQKHEPPSAAAPSNPRRLKITMQTLREYKLTEGCPQCTHVKEFGEAKPGLAHSEACRKRILDAMTQSTAGQARIDRHEERIDRAIAERIRHADESRPQAAPRPVQTSASSSATSSGPLAHQSNPTLSGSGARSCVPTDEAVTPKPSDEAGDDAMDEDIIGENAAEAAEPEGDEEMIGLVNTVEDEYVSMLGMLGAHTGAFKRENRKAYNRIVSELYSPPRVTRMASALPSFKVLPGYAFDITVNDPEDGEPWDFDVRAKRDKARMLLREQKPLFVVGSPMCTAWCTWQRLNKLKRDPETCRRERVRARLHLDFVMEIYREQIDAGRFFLHEHPDGSDSWTEKCCNKIMNIEGVGRVVADQCQYDNFVTFGLQKGFPVKKPTGFMSNAPELLAQLQARCSGRGGECSSRAGARHAKCEGKVAREAAKYSDKLCTAILKGMYNQMRASGIVNDHEVGLHAVTDDGEFKKAFKAKDPRYSGKCKDDMTGQVLRDDLVREARAKELLYFKSKGVWMKRPRREARQFTGRPPITVRWVDVNKGDDLNPKYRSRLVARQLKAHDRSNNSYFAPTPPLEALRTVISMAASKMENWEPNYDPTAEDRMQISLMDISRAYFNAKTDPESPTYVSLPAEEEDHEEMCGLLLRHMYGTRAAADGWQEEYSSFLVESLGFKQGLASPCLFKHPGRQIALSVHGDDFTAAGAKFQLDWLEESMKEHYELTIQPRLGPGPEDGKEAIILNRVIRWTEHGIELEADPRQAEKLIAECGMDGVNSVATPGVRQGFEQVEHDEELPERLHSAFRGAAARANYLAADRLDCQFAAKEVCRWMAKPTQSSWTALKRLCRYLVGLPRLVHVYRWQSANTIDVYTDTDWAGCPRTRKSTSGGCIMLGAHTIKTWSSTQSSISLSSGEAEFNGVVRGSGAGLGYRSLLRDLGQELPLRVWTDSSAALGICSRQGLGKLRHLDTHTLWIQQAVRTKAVDLRKIAGEVNPADLFTKHSLTREKLMALTKLFDSEYRGGRADSAAKTRTTPGMKTTMAEAHANMQTLVEAYAVDDQSGLEPIMPHKSFTEETLNKMYPAVTVPEAVDAGDPQTDAKDPLVEAGLREAEEIMRAAELQGRRRRAAELSVSFQD